MRIENATLNSYNSKCKAAREHRRKEVEIMATIKKIVSELENMFEMFNDEYYGGELDRPIITVAPDPKANKISGWCTNYKAWKDEDGGYYEINICAEFLNQPIENIAAEMLHEMTHLYGLKNNIQTASRGGHLPQQEICRNCRSSRAKNRKK